MALSSSSPYSPSIFAAAQFSTDHSPLPKVTTFSFSNSKSSNQTIPFNLSCTKSSSFNRLIPKVSFFPAFLNRSSKDAKVLKEELLDAIEPLDRGAEATPEDQQRVDELARKLEAVNPTKQPLKSDLLDGKWELIYTTSQSILQTQRPKFLRSRTNYQAINADTLRAQNMESWPFFNQVTADLTPLNAKRVAVKFDTFKIGGLVPIKAPERARGELEITYLDEELRVSRGDKGNLFILKMVDPSYRVPATANLVPLNARRVAVHFDFFKIAGLIPIKSPGSGRGQLEITYLDDEMSYEYQEVTDRGNLCILRMVDPSYLILRLLDDCRL